MSRLTIDTPSRADLVMEQLYKDLERRIESSPPGLCPVDLSRCIFELAMLRLVENVYLAVSVLVS